jgi:branched-chain amino acid transport system substrate-binding protein
MRGRRYLLLAIAVGVAAALAGCGSSSGGSGGKSAADQPYRILVTAGLSTQGVLADNAETSALSARASAAVINSEGGIDGRKVDVTVVDDGGSPTTAVTDLRSALASSTPPDAYLNSGPSTIAAATLPILNQHKILSFNIGATATSSDAADFPLNFDLTPSAADYAKGFVAYIKQKGYTKVGIIHGDDAYGDSFGQSIDSALTAAGLKVTSDEAYDDTALDMTPQLSAVQATHPQLLIMDAYGAPAGYLLKGIQQLGWNLPILGDTSVAATSLISTPAPGGLLGTSEVKNLLVQVFASTEYSASATGVNAAVTAMTKIGSIQSSLILAYNYDAVRLIAAAAKHAGSASNATALAAALEDPAVQSAARTVILPLYSFTSTSHAPNAGASAFAFVQPSTIKDGQFQPAG